MVLLPCLHALPHSLTAVAEGCTNWRPKGGRRNGRAESVLDFLRDICFPVCLHGRRLCCLDSRCHVSLSLHINPCPKPFVLNGAGCIALVEDGVGAAAPQPRPPRASQEKSPQPASAGPPFLKRGKAKYTAPSRKGARRDRKTLRRFIARDARNSRKKRGSVWGHYAQNGDPICEACGECLSVLVDAFSSDGTWDSVAESCAKKPEYDEEFDVACEIKAKERDRPF